MSREVPTMTLSVSAGSGPDDVAGAAARARLSVRAGRAIATAARRPWTGRGAAAGVNAGVEAARTRGREEDEEEDKEEG